MPCDDPVVDESLRVALAPRAARTARSPRGPGAPAHRVSSGDVARTADVVGMHVRDDDRSIGASSASSTGRQRSSGSRDAEAGVDEDPAAVRRSAGSSSGRGRCPNGSEKVTRRSPSSTSTMREKLPRRDGAAARAQRRLGPVRAGRRAARRLADGRRGRDRRAARRERRRQDDDAARRLRDGAPQRRRRSSAASACAAPARSRSRAPASRTFPKGRGIFAELTVWENLRMGAYMRRGRPDFATVLDYFPWLEARRNQQAGTLSGGEQQMLALARAFLAAAAAPDARRAVARPRAARSRARCSGSSAS